MVNTQLSSESFRIIEMQTLVNLLELSHGPALHSGNPGTCKELVQENTGPLAAPEQTEIGEQSLVQPVPEYRTIMDPSASLSQAQDNNLSRDAGNSDIELGRQNDMEETLRQEL
jgi:hypothetical protein